MAIQIKRGTSAQRKASEVVLEAGQPFLETDTGNLFVGKTGTEKLRDLTLDASYPTVKTINSMMTNTEWGTGVSGSLALLGQGAGLYQIKANFNGGVTCFAYWDGKSNYGNGSDWVSMELDTDGFWIYHLNFYIEQKKIMCKRYAYHLVNGNMTKEVDSFFTDFTYRKISN